MIVLVLFGIWPFVSFLSYNFFSHNQDDAIIFGQHILVYAVAFLVLLTLFAVIVKAGLPKTPFAKIANVLAAAVVVLFNYFALDQLLSGFGIALGTVKIAIWLLILIAVVVAVWRLSSWRQTSLVFAVMGGVMVAIPAAQFTWYAMQIPTAPMPGNDDQATLAPPSRTNPSAAALPSVYWFILDMYARQDVLEKYSGFANQEFLQSLKDRGFFVAERAVANYPSTQLTLSTTVSMSYIFKEGKVERALWTKPLHGFNPTVDRFLALGYRYFHVEPHNNPRTRCGGREDKCIKPRITGAFGIGEAEVGLLKLTPLYRIIRRLAPNLLSIGYITIDEVMSKLDPASDAPLFLFAHILSPHPPPRFTTNCSPIENLDWALIRDDADKVLEGYFTDLRCLNPLVVDVVDRILASDPSDPIIIIQGDHGIRNVGSIEPRPTPEIEPWFLDHAILHAMRLPERCDKGSDHDFSSINTFRVVFNCILGERVELLPTRIFSTYTYGAKGLHESGVREMFPESPGGLHFQ